MAENQEDPIKAAKLYENLLNDGYTEKNLGTVDEFVRAVSDKKRATSIYDNLLSDGYTEENLGTIDEFLTTFTTPAQFTTPQEIYAGEVSPVVGDNVSPENQIALQAPRKSSEQGLDTPSTQTNPTNQNFSDQEWIAAQDDVLKVPTWFDTTVLIENRNKAPKDTLLIQYAKPDNPLFSKRSLYYNDKNEENVSVGEWTRNENNEQVFKLGDFNKERNNLLEIGTYFNRMYPDYTLVDTDGETIYKKGEYTGKLAGTPTDYLPDALINLNQNIPEFVVQKDYENAVWESTKNSVENIGTRLEQFLPATRIFTGTGLQKILGKELAGRVSAWQDIDLQQRINDDYARLEQLDNEILPTYNVVDGIKDGSFNGIVGGVVDAVGNVVSSIPAILGTGVAGDMIADYNVAKANRLGISVEELYDSNQADFVAPATLGFISSQLEKIGLKGISGSILGKLGTKTGERFMTLLSTANKEGLTELLQTPLEDVNRLIANNPDVSVDEAVQVYVDNLVSEKAFKAYVIGAVAGGAATGLGKLLRAPIDLAVNNKIKLNLEEIESLNKDLNLALPGSSVEQVLNEKVTTLIDEVEQANAEFETKVENLTEEDQKQLNSKLEEIKANDNVLANEKVSDQTKQAVEERQTVLRDEINEMISDPSDNDLTIQETIPTPTEKKLGEIRTRREEIRQRLRQNLGNLNAGVNPEVLTDLVKLGATYVEEGIVNIRDFAARIKEDYGRDIDDKQLREIFVDSAKEAGYNVRGFSERIRNSEDTTEETRVSVEDFETLYRTQNYAEIKDRISQLTEEEKRQFVNRVSETTAQLNPDDNIGVLAGIDLYNQYVAEGRTQEAGQLIEQLSKTATVAAQTLRQYGELKTSTPEGYVQLVQKWLEKSKKKLTDNQKQQISDLYNERQELSNQVDQREEALLNDLSKENYDAYYQAQIELENSVRGLEDYIDNIKGGKPIETLAKVLQGNLLTLKSVTINPFANAIQGLIRVAENDVATAIDQITKLVTKEVTKSPTFTRDNISRSGGAAVRGLKKATRKAVKGSAASELSKYDVGTRLKPFVAIKRLYTNLFLEQDPDNPYSIEQGINDAIVGTVGVPANVMFRLLPFGDDPFFEQARVQRLVEIGRTTKNLTGEALEKFIIRPDKASADEANRYGREATFQEENFISRNINQILNEAGQAVGRFGGEYAEQIFKLISRAILPFVNTPSSIAIKTVKFAVPSIPFVQAMVDLSSLRKALKMSKDSKLRQTLIQRHQKAFAEHMGEFIVSGTVLSAVGILVANGLVTGDLPDEKFEQKQRAFMFATQPPNTINISGLRRLLAGEDTAYQQGDNVQSYVPYGLLGAMIGIVDKTQGTALKEAAKKEDIRTTTGEAYYPSIDKTANPLLNPIGTLPASLQYFFNQSFVQGAETVLKSISQDGVSQLPNQLVKTFSTIGIPNTVSQAFRASNEYMRDIYSDDQAETFANIVAEKVGNVEDLPIKYDMWGKPIRQTPEGSDPYLYQMVDIFRTQEILNDKLTYYVFDIQRKTGDDAAIPGTVADSFNKKDFKIKLNKQEKSELAKLIGEERRKLTERVLKTYNPQTSDPEKFIPRLQRAYEVGATRARNKFKKQKGIK